MTKEVDTKSEQILVCNVWHVLHPVPYYYRENVMGIMVLIVTLMPIFSIVTEIDIF